MLRRAGSPLGKGNFSVKPLGKANLFAYTVTTPFVQRRRIANEPTPSPYRQQLKLEAKRRKQNEGVQNNAEIDHAAWELTVGIEIHAQLNTERKLFSSASTASTNEPNSNIALCDLAYPGAQPVFQIATLLPALRAALALNCEIQRKSSFDRKHYFYPDQPAGYQITQFYGMLGFI
jgi:aspartyl-tRNA(Asn)/glutamyl-tRNA(Gln) amidotransferase subunit B